MIVEIEEIEKHNPIKSKTGYSCPECDCYNGETMMQTKPVFKELWSENYTWVELIKCEKCECVYTINNGT